MSLGIHHRNSVAHPDTFDEDKLELEELLNDRDVALRTRHTLEPLSAHVGAIRLALVPLAG